MINRLIEKEKDISLRSLSPMVSFHNLNSQENSVDYDAMDTEVKYQTIEKEKFFSEAKSLDLKGRKKFA